jgi:Fanconi anemia group M protein
MDYILELLETQTLNCALKFIEKLKKDPSKSAKSLINESWFSKCVRLLNEAIEKGVDNPKIKKIVEIIEDQLKNNNKSKIIIFANFRNTVEDMTNILNKIDGISAIKLVGQKEGISQKKQIATIKQFEEGLYNVLVGTSISEEGLNISGGSDLAIFYDNVSTSIRRIQRAGRVGRIKAGRIIFLMNKDTRDIAYYWKSKKEENKMKNILTNMNNKEIQSSLK